MKENDDMVQNAFETETNQIVQWDNKYATGIELIDNQHKELINLTNMLYQACLSGQGESAFKEAMGRMVEYVRVHFDSEQKLLERIGYPEYHAHKKQHDTMVRDILEAANDYKSGKLLVPNKFVRTLRDWILGHIAVEDKQYAAFIAENKVRINAQNTA
jgi:hemerythrin-like metal-binding protein